MPDKKDLQRKYVQLQILRQQFNAMLEEKVMLDNKTNEIRVTIESLSKIHEIKKGEEMWSTLGSGTFVRADLKDVGRVIIEIGAGVFAMKSAAEASEILQKRLNELENFDAELVTEINKINQQITRLEPEIQRLASAMEDGSGK